MFLPHQDEFWMERRYSNEVLENAPYIVIILNSEGKICYFNKAVESILGYDLEEKVGRRIEDFLHPDDIPIYVEARDRVLANNMANHVVIRVKHAKEGWRWMQCHGRMVSAPSGARELVVHAIDITDSREAEMALELANRKLNILGSATRHDVLNSLTGLFGYLELAESKATDEAVLKYIRKARGVSEVVKKQMEFTKLYQEIGSKRPEWVNVSEAIKRSMMSLSMNQVKVTIDVDDLEIYSDPMVEKVFYNLLENSLRHGDVLKRIDISLEPTDHSMLLIFQDDGKGVPQEEKELIFKRGYGKNTGYGLYVSKEVLSITGLTLRENGTPGKGARFEIGIPPGKFRK